MPRRLKRCAACGIKRRDLDRDDPKLCGRCSDDLEAKRNYEPDPRYNLPQDEASEEELRALICLDVNSEAQEVMAKRIERMTKKIQDNWTDGQRERRSTSKKKSCQPHSLSSLGLERKHRWMQI